MLVKPIFCNLYQTLAVVVIMSMLEHHFGDMQTFDIKLRLYNIDKYNYFNYWLIHLGSELVNGQLVISDTGVC